MFDPPEPPLSAAPVTVLDAVTAPADVAAWAAVTEPGAGVVGPLTAVDPARVDGAAQVDLLIALERQIAWLHAAQQRVLAALDGSALDWAGKQSVDYTEEQVGAALRLSPGHAAERLGAARVLVDRLPATLGMLQRGEITYLHAKTVAVAVEPFDDKTTATIEDRVRTRAADQTVGQFRASVRRAVIAPAPSKNRARLPRHRENPW